MSNPEHSKAGTSEEIDLGQFFVHIGNGFRAVFHFFLAAFAYLKRNIIWLGGSAVLGGLIGFAANSFEEERQKLDVIVTPNLDDSYYLYDTRGYLFDIVSEIQSEINANDTVFFNKLEMDISKMQGFEVEVIPLKVQNKEALESENLILEELKEFAGYQAIDDILRAEFQVRTRRDQRITFYFRDPVIGEDYARKLITYINSNPYYKDLVKIQKENASQRIETNDSLIRQIARLVKTYMDRMAKQQTGKRNQPGPIDYR